MALKKSTLFWVDGRNNGWSNSFYYDDGSSTLSQPNKALAMAALMCKMMGEGTRLTFIRESFDAIKGDGFLYEVPATANYAGVTGKPMEAAPSCVLFYMGNLAWTRKKAIYQHAIWDTRVTGGALAMPAGYSVAQTNWINELKNGWGWKGKTGQTQQAITAVEVAAGNTVRLTVAGDLFPGPFDGRRVQVRASGVQSIPRMRNPLVVIPTSERVCVTLRQFAQPVLAAGQLVLSTYGFLPCERAAPERAASHKVGRPFRPQAGGRSRVR